MQALALWYRQEGFDVTGCDPFVASALPALRAGGVEAFAGHDVSHAALADVFVHSMAVPADHPELVALRAAPRGGRKELFTTLEPCLMCAGATVLARVPRLVLGAWDPKAGACGSQWDVVRDRRLNHRVEVVGGVREEECAAVLREFFAGHR